MIHEPSASTGSAAGTEDRLRAALDTLASNVHPAPDAYRTVQREWRRRERKRRLVLAVLAAVVFTVADIAGLWALNHAHNHPHVIFNDRVPGRIVDTPGSGPARDGGGY